VQSQATPSDNAANKEENSEQQYRDNEEGGIEGGPLPPPPGYGTPTNLLLSSNVLKKVASFSVERSGNSSSNSNSNSVSNAQLLAAGEEKDKDRDKDKERDKETTLTATSTEQQQQTVAAGGGSRRGSSFVPEKLSFAAYEKFEGKSHQIFLSFPLRSPQTQVKRSQRGRCKGGKLPGLNISLTNDFCAFLFAFFVKLGKLAPRLIAFAVCPKLTISFPLTQFSLTPNLFPP